MKSLATLVLFCFIKVASSQISTEDAVIDFGVVERGSDKVRDIVIKNEGKNKSLILKSNFSREFDILFSSRDILPDSSVVLRVKFKPLQKGKFSEKVELWFSTENKALTLEFRADVLWLDPSDNSPCPDFNNRPYDCCPNDEFEVLVKDANTGKPLNARLRILNQGKILIDESLGQKGQFISSVPVSWYYLEASMQGYLSADTATYINRRSNYFELFLQPLELEPNADFTDNVEEASIPLGVIQNEETENPVSTVTETAEESEAFIFKRRNNVVFLIDVSQSMAGMGKMDLLKASMYELVSSLREIDNVSVITYASDAKLVLPLTDGSQKEDILSTVNGLVAGGMTSGTRGFRMAYDIASKGFIEGGNNQVIVVTDGAFRASDNPQIVDMTSKQYQRGIKTSIAGIKSKPLAVVALTEIAETGGGHFVSIGNLDEARTALFEEVRNQSADE